MNIQFSFQRKFSLSKRRGLKNFMKRLSKKERVLFNEVQFVFCDDASILSINQQFLQHNYYTDIITFNLSAPGQKAIDAEIYISVDTVRTNAALFHTSFKNEIHRVIFHGLLHLCGYNDKTLAQQKEMRAMEDYYLQLYFSNI